MDAYAHSDQAQGLWWLHLSHEARSQMASTEQISLGDSGLCSTPQQEAPGHANSNNSAATAPAAGTTTEACRPKPCPAPLLLAARGPAVVLGT